MTRRSEPPPELRARRAPGDQDAASLALLARLLNRIPTRARGHAVGRLLLSRYRRGITHLLGSTSQHAAEAARSNGADSLPAPVAIDFAEPVRSYWLKRIEQTKSDRYAGVPIAKLPEDLRVYEHLIWLSRPTVVIELGVHHGGSALWFRDRLRAAHAYGRTTDPGRVIGVDRDTTASRAALRSADPEFERSITLLDGDVRDPAVAAAVAKHVPDGACCMVVEDSAHTYTSTAAALRGFARFVAPGGFFVVEDGSVDIEEMRPQTSWPRGVLPAIADWLASADGEDFIRRRDLELYGLSSNPYGFLQRRTGPT